MPSLRPVWAMLTSFHSADSISTSVVASETAGNLAAHDAGERFDAGLVGNDADAGVEAIDLAVEREQRFALAGAAHREVALDLRGIEHVQAAGRGRRS